jgi:hypothetical protein
MRLKMWTTLAVGVVLVGCATSGADYQPIVDTKGINAAQYQNDLAECQSIAQQTQPVGNAAAKDAGAGAAIGAVLGSIGGNKTSVMQSAGVGAVMGGLSGGASSIKEKNTVLRNCLRGRGYNVLN